jgi:hypothetical protein
MAFAPDAILRNVTVYRPDTTLRRIRFFSSDWAQCHYLASATIYFAAGDNVVWFTRGSSFLGAPHRQARKVLFGTTHAVLSISPTRSIENCCYKFFDSVHPQPDWEFKMFFFLI